MITSGKAIFDLNGGARLFGAFTMGDAWIDQDILIHQDAALDSEVPAVQTQWVLYNELDG